MTVKTRSALSLLMLACASVPAGLWPASAAAQERSYVLGPDDVIDVQVYGEFPQAVRLRIRPDGTISLPLIGNIRAADQTPGQLAETLRELYLNGGYYNSPVVNVEVVSYTSRSATVLGAVRTPGVVPLIRPTTLTNVIATAGGQLEGAQTAILRRPGAGEQRFVIAEVAGTPADPVLVPGDVVVVPQAERFFVYGQVRTPGAFPLEPGMTMRQALAQAGGQNDAGTERSIRLHRDNQRSDVKDLDQSVRPGDVLFIRERIF